MLRERQRELVQKIVNQHENVADETRAASLKWKILIHDERSISILSSLVKMQKLMDVGVTLIRPINSKRDPIPDVVAVYMVEPTLENLEIIANDVKEGLYDTIYLSFISPIATQDLRHLADQIAMESDGRCIQGVFDEYIDFASPDPGLFTLFEKKSYLPEIYGMHTDDDTVHAAINQIAESLVSVILTTGQIPNVAYKKDSVSNYIVDKVSEMMKPLAENLELWENRKIQTTEAPPLFIFMDRTQDLVSGLYHSDKYQPLIDDIFGITRNTITVDNKPADLDTDIDTMWSELRFNGYEDAKKEIADKSKAFTDQYGAMAEKPEFDKLNETISKFHEIQRLSVAVQSHTRIAWEIQQEMERTKAYLAHHAEVDLITRRGSPKIELETMTRAYDRLRLLLIAFLYEAVTPEQARALIPIALEGTAERKPEVAEVEAALNAVQSARIGGSGGFIHGALKMIAGSTQAEPCLPLVVRVQKLLDGADTDFVVKGLVSGRSATARDSSSAAVFVCGPGSYSEYCALMRLASDRRGLSMTYGCTCLERPDEFVDDIIQMAK